MRRTLDDKPIAIHAGGKERTAIFSDQTTPRPPVLPDPPPAKKPALILWITVAIWSGLLLLYLFSRSIP
jgi:hypothetical protein